MSTDRQRDIESEIGIKSVRVEDGKALIETTQPPEVLLHFINGFKDILDNQDAPNYVQMSVTGKDEPNTYVCTIQRQEGKTPHELRAEAEAALEQAETELSSLREAADKALDWLITHPNARGLSEAKTTLATLLDPSPSDPRERTKR